MPAGKRNFEDLQSASGRGATGVTNSRGDVVTVIDKGSKKIEMSNNNCIEVLQKALLDFECKKIQGVELVRIFDDRVADDSPDDLQEDVAEIYHDLHTQLALYTPDPSEQGSYYIGDEKLSLLVKGAVEKLK